MGVLDGLRLEWIERAKHESDGQDEYGALGTGVMFRDAVRDSWLPWDDPRFAAEGVLLLKVAGVSFRPDALSDRRWEVGARVRLVPEPTNAHDPDAIAIFDLGRSRQAGYVPRALTGAVRRLGPPEETAAIVFFEWAQQDGTRSALRCALGPEPFVARLEAFIRRSRRYASRASS